jgi:hypothetical protein
MISSNYSSTRQWMEVSSQPHAVADLLSGKDPLNGRLGGTQSQSGRFGEDTNTFPLTRPESFFFTNLYTRLTSCTDETVADNQLIFVH